MLKLCCKSRSSERLWTNCDRLCGSSPASVAGVTGSRSEAPIIIIWMTDFKVILLPALAFAQHPVGFAQLHKLAVQRRVWWVTIRVQLQLHVISGSVTIWWSPPTPPSNIEVTWCRKKDCIHNQAFSIQGKLFQLTIIWKIQGKYTCDSLFTLEATWKQSGRPLWES